jgi:xylulokinase
VLQPGEVAATAGTSGVVYAVSDRPVADPGQRVNAFAHVNYTAARPLTGVLLCLNGAGSQYRWLRHTLGNVDYDQMEALAAAVPPGSDGLLALPFGNGAERLLGNRDLGARWLDLDFNRHHRGHLCRAALEGVAAAFAYGMEALRSLGLPLHVVRAPGDNLFRSAVFSQTLATLSGCRIEVYDTTGAEGAARGAGVGAGLYASARAALGPLPKLRAFAPSEAPGPLDQVFERWRQALDAYPSQPTTR